MKTGIELIAEERQRQIDKENWSGEHDKQHSCGELSAAAAFYAVNKHEMKMRVQVWLDDESDFLINNGDRGDRKLIKAGWYNQFPFDSNWDKREKHGRLKSLQIAGALIAAEIDRLLSIKQ